MYKTYYDKREKLWSGRSTEPLYNPKINLGQVLLSSMSTYGSKIAQVLERIIHSIKGDTVFFLIL